MQRSAQIAYVARDKVKGVPHHAKAGNINSALLKEAPGNGDFILVLDCDMVVHPDFLMRALGHFYQQEADQETFQHHYGAASGPADPSGADQDQHRQHARQQPCVSGQPGMSEHRQVHPGATAGQGVWMLKEEAAFIQTPQVGCITVIAYKISHVRLQCLSVALQQAEHIACALSRQPACLPAMICFLGGVLAL